MAETSSPSETVSPSAPRPGSPGRAARPGSLGRAASTRLRAQLTTTPGRLRLIAVGLVAAAVVIGLVAWGAEQSREHAAQAVASRTEPLLVQSVKLYSSLSDANATATATFLTGGLEPAARRQLYLADLRSASAALASLSAEVGSSAADRGAVQEITAQLPTYSGLVESARAFNIEGQPVGAANLRAASQLLSTAILPAADRIYTTEARRLGADYTSGTQVGSLIVFALAAILLLAGLLLTQRYVTAISNRTVNVPLLAGTGVLVALSLWSVLGMLGEQSALARAQRDGSDPVELLSTMRILISRAESDDSLSLVARGGDLTHPADASAVIATLVGADGAGGLLHAAEPRIGLGAAQELGADLHAYRGQHAQIALLLGRGAVPQAIDLAVGSAKSPSSPSLRLSRDLDAQTATAQARFASAASDATSSLSGLSPAILVLTALAAGLALLGLRPRIREYL